MPIRENEINCILRPNGLVNFISLINDFLILISGTFIQYQAYAGYQLEPLF